MMSEMREDIKMEVSYVEDSSQKESLEEIQLLKDKQMVEDKSSSHCLEKSAKPVHQGCRQTEELCQKSSIPGMTMEEENKLRCFVNLHRLQFVSINNSIKIIHRCPYCTIRPRIEKSNNNKIIKPKFRLSCQMCSKKRKFSRISFIKHVIKHLKTEERVKNNFDKPIKKLIKHMETEKLERKLADKEATHEVLIHETVIKPNNKDLVSVEDTENHLSHLQTYDATKIIVAEPDCVIIKPELAVDLDTAEDNKNIHQSHHEIEFNATQIIVAEPDCVIIKPELAVDLDTAEDNKNIHQSHLKKNENIFVEPKSAVGISTIDNSENTFSSQLKQDKLNVTQNISEKTNAVDIKSENDNFLIDLVTVEDTENDNFLIDLVTVEDTENDNFLIDLVTVEDTENDNFLIDLVTVEDTENKLPDSLKKDKLTFEKLNPLTIEPKNEDLGRVKATKNISKKRKRDTEQISGNSKRVNITSENVEEVLMNFADIKPKIRPKINQVTENTFGTSKSVTIKSKKEEVVFMNIVTTEDAKNTFKTHLKKYFLAQKTSVKSTTEKDVLFLGMGTGDTEDNDNSKLDNASAPNKSKLICQFCFKGFKSKYSLKQHILIHTQPSGWFCKICSQEFSNKYKFAVHKAICKDRLS